MKAFTSGNLFVRHLTTIMLGALASGSATRVGAQEAAVPVATRVEIADAALSAEQRAASSPDARERRAQQQLASTLRQRLRDGDFQVGDRLVVSILSDAMHTDTVVVRAGRMLDLPGQLTVPLTGVLRSEVEDRVAAEVEKLVKAQRVEVTPLVRLAVLGEVAHPGYFAFAYDTPLHDAVMSAGGPTAMADMHRATIQRGGLEIRGSRETSRAIGGGLTLEQFGVVPGDELVIGERKRFNSGPIIASIGALASLVTVYVALHR